LKPWLLILALMIAVLSVSLAAMLLAQPQSGILDSLLEIAAWGTLTVFHILALLCIVFVVPAAVVIRHARRRRLERVDGEANNGHEQH
jgi:hypothetical protein